MTKDLTEGLVLDLDMETLQDYSGNSNDGTATGTSLTTDKDGRYNQARSLDGSDSDYITIPNILENEGSFSIWFKNNNLANDCMIIDSTKSGVSDYLFFRAYGPGDYYYVKLGNDGAQLPSLSLDTDWHLGTFVWDTISAWKFYFDGVLVVTGSGVKSPASSEPLYLGRHTVTGYGLDGSISKPKIWNRASTAEEVYQDYLGVSHNYQGLLDGLVAGYDFKGDAKDFSGNGYDGVVSGASLTTDQFGIVDSAYSFDGSNDYITIPHEILDGLSDYTVIALVYFNNPSTTDYDEIVCGSDESGNTAGLFFDRATTDIRFADNGNWNATLAQVAHGWTSAGWHTLSGVADSSDGHYKLYLDGEYKVSSSGHANASSISNDLYVGARKNSSTVGKVLDGKEGVLLFFNVAKSAEEIKTITDLLSKGKLYPYPEQVFSGVTE